MEFDLLRICWWRVCRLGLAVFGLLWAISCPLLSQASFLGSNVNWDQELKNSKFIFPNEGHHNEAKELLTQTPEQGAYVSVGTERSFLGFGFSNASHLVLADVNSLVALFNEALLEVIKLAPTGEKFHRLRTEPEVLAELVEAEITDPEKREKLLRVYRSQWWKTHNGPSTNWYVSERFDLFFQNPIRYWREAKAYKRIYEAAVAERISVRVINLADIDQVSQLASDLYEQGVGLSALDISNAWADEFLGSKGVSNLLESFSGVSTAESLLVTTWIPNKETGRRAGYTGFSFGYLSEQGFHHSGRSLAEFAESLKINLSCSERL